MYKASGILISVLSLLLLDLSRCEGVVLIEQSYLRTQITQYHPEKCNDPYGYCFNQVSDTSDDSPPHDAEDFDKNNQIEEEEDFKPIRCDSPSGWCIPLAGGSISEREEQGAKPERCNSSSGWCLNGEPLKWYAGEQDQETLEENKVKNSSSEDEFSLVDPLRY